MTDLDAAVLKAELEKALNAKKLWPVPSFRYIMNQHLGVAALIAFALMIGPASRYRAPSYAGPKAIMPLPWWGAALAVCVAGATTARIIDRRGLLAYALIGIQAIYGGFLFSYVVIFFVNDAVSPLPVIMYLSLSLTISALWVLLKRDE